MTAFQPGDATVHGKPAGRNLYHPFGQPVPWDTRAQVVAESKGRTRERYDGDAGLQYLNARDDGPANRLAECLHPR